jgi:hypothetical protein
MKKTVVLALKDTVVVSDEIDGNKYYGFNISGNSPGYISSSGEYGNDGTYNARFFDGMTKSNRWYSHDYDTLQEVVDELLQAGHEVFQFDTYTELFRWAISGK